MSEVIKTIVEPRGCDVRRNATQGALKEQGTGVVRAFPAQRPWLPVPTPRARHSTKWVLMGASPPTRP